MNRSAIWPRCGSAIWHARLRPAALLRGFGGGEELVEQCLDAEVDLVADGPHGLDAFAGGVVELPVQVGLAGKIGQASPQPMVITTSLASTVSVVRILGRWSAMSIPTSFIAWDRGGVNSVGGDAAGGPDLDGVTCQDGEEAGGHL